MEVAAAFRSLAEGSLLSSLPPDVRSDLLTHARVRRCRAGEPVCLQGAPADRLVIPVDAPLALFFRSPDGALAHLGELQERRSLNLAAVLRGGAWEYVAQAKKACHVLEVPAAALLSGLQKTPGLVAYLDLMTGSRGFRDFAATLRRQGCADGDLWALAFVTVREEVAVGALVLSSEDASSRLIIPDTCRCQLVLAAQLDKPILAELTSGEYYGVSHVLGSNSALEVRCLEAGQLLFVAETELRRLFARHPLLRTALEQEHPAVRERVRPGLAEAGLQATRVFNVNALLPSLQSAFDEPSDADGDDALVQHTQGFSLSAVQLRRMEGVRSEEKDSGAAALASVLSFFNRPTSYDEIRRRLARRLPPSLLDLASVAEDSGLVCHAAEVPRGTDLMTLDVPFITTRGQRFVVVHRIESREITTFDPIAGLTTTRRKRFEEEWSRKVLIVRDPAPFYAHHTEKEPTPKKKQKQEAAPAPKPGFVDTWLRYFALLGSGRQLLRTVAGLSLALLVFGTVSPRLNQLVVDEAIQRGNGATLGVFCLAIVLVELSVILLGGMRRVVIAQIARVFDFQLSTIFYRHALSVGLDVHSEERVGKMLSRAREVERIRESFSSDGMQILLSVASSVIYVLVVGTYSVTFSFVLLGAGALGFLVARLGGSRYRALYQRLFDRSAKLSSLATEQVSGIASIKAIGAEGAAKRAWDSQLAEQTRLQRRVINTNVATMSAIGGVQQLAMIGVTFFAVKLGLGGHLSLGGMLAVSQYAGMALAPLLSLGQYLDSLNQLVISFQKLDEIFDEKLEVGGGDELGLEPRFSGKVTLKDVRFRYEEDGREVLSGISFEAMPGECIAIVGRSGSGKTTLAKLLQGLVRPTAGQIFLDQYDTATLPLSVLRRNVGMVMQDSLLFGGTIVSNIAFSDDKPDVRRVVQAAKLSAAAGFIGELPNGYRTFLAEQGMGLSGGQKQRVNIARALYRDPRILIMDEATSSLDAESERAIVGNLGGMLHGRTAFIIAHRLSTVRGANRILVIDEGRIVEQGSHDELLARRGVYHGLFSQQLVGA